MPWDDYRSLMTYQEYQKTDDYRKCQNEKSKRSYERNKEWLKQESKKKYDEQSSIQFHCKVCDVFIKLPSKRSHIK